MQVASNTDLMQARFRPDMYSTYVRHEMFGIVESEAEAKWIRADDIGINYEAFKEGVGKWLYGWIRDNVNAELPERIQFIETEVTIQSPRQYNFATDNMNVLLEVDVEKLWEYVGG